MTATDVYERILPPVTDLNRPYWDGLEQDELRVQHCVHDGAVWFPASPVCPTCLSTDFEWRPVSGRATLWSWIRMHQKYFDAFEDQRPYLVAFVKLEEGPFMMSTVLADLAQLSVDAPLQLIFTDFGGRRIPAFTLAQ